VATGDTVTTLETFDTERDGYPSALSFIDHGGVHRIKFRSGEMDARFGAGKGRDEGLSE